MTEPSQSTESAASTEPAAPTESTLYEKFGGDAFFTDFIARFYEGVSADPPLRALYPEIDLGPAEIRMRTFLQQYWGGPKTYQENRGHPRLGMRHIPFVIDEAQRDRWLTHMANALEVTAREHELDESLKQELWAYLARAAVAMTNN